MNATAHAILIMIADHFHISLDQLLSPRRIYAKERFVAMYVLRHGLGITLREVGSYVGRDHSGVTHGLKQIDNLTHPGIEEEVEHLLKLVKDTKYSEHMSVNTIYSRKEREPVIWFQYGDNQDCCGIFKMSMV